MTYHFKNKNVVKIIMSYILVFTLSFGGFTLVEQLSPFAGPKAKLKSIDVSMKENSRIRKQGTTYYMVTGTSAKITVKPKLTRNVKLKSTRRFKTSKKRIISVTSTGKVKARKTGQSYITVKVTTKKTKNLAKSSKTKKFRIVSLSFSAFNNKFNKVAAKQESLVVEKQQVGAGSSIPQKVKSMQEILDDMVDSSGTLWLTTDFYNKYPQYKSDSYLYSVPTETTKAKKIVLPELNFAGFQKYNLKSLRTDIVYSVPYNIEFEYDNFSRETALSDNQANITIYNGFYGFDKKGQFTGDPFLRPYFSGWDGGISKLKIQNSSNKKWYTFQFEVYKPDTNSKNYKRYTTMKNICKTSFNDCSTDKEKVMKVMELVQSGKVGNVESYSYSSEIYAELTSQYCNLMGIPCGIRTAIYDKPYGQSFNYVNCLALLDGKPYVVDPKSKTLFPYSDFCDINCRYLDYTNYRGTNLQGIIDKGLCLKVNACIYKDILDKAGYHPQYSN